jgi:hypothetical protein
VAPSINWRTSTRSARLSTMSLDPNLDKYLRRRHQASVVPKKCVLHRSGRLEGGEPSARRADSPFDKEATLGPPALLSTVSLDPNLH